MPRIQDSIQQVKSHKKKILATVRFGFVLWCGLMFVADLVIGILGGFSSILWWISIIAFSFAFVGLSYLFLGKRAFKWTTILVSVGFLALFPLFSAKLILTYQSVAQNLVIPEKAEYFRNVLEKSYNYTELYRWENSTIRWNSSSTMIFHLDPIQIYEYGQARCGGYAILYAELCISQGYETRIVVSVFQNHVWNEVKLNGTWTRVDASPTGAPMSENIGYPLFYEEKWGNPPILALAFENSSIEDVTSNYRSDHWSLLSGATFVFLFIGAWLAIYLFLIWKKRRLLFANKLIAARIFRLKQMRYRTLYRLKRIFLPITAFRCVILVGIALLTAFFLLPHYFQFNDDSRTAASLLVSYSQLLTTIFAITLSITLIGVQYLAQMYTPRSISGYFKDRFFAGFFGLYVVSILLNLLVASFPLTISPSSFVLPSLLLLALCLMYLVAYPFHVISKLQPAQILKRVSASIPRNLFQIIAEEPYRSRVLTDSAREPFIVLEQMIIKSIRNNDYDLYIQSLNYLTKTSLALIDEAKKEYIKKKNLDLLAQRTDNIVGFVYRPLNQTKIEVFQAKNEFFIVSLLNRVEKIVERLHEAKAIRSLRYIYELYDGIGDFAFKNDLESIAEEYCRSIDRIVKVEMKINEFGLTPFEEPLPIDRHRLTEEQKTERSFNRIMFDYFEHHRLDSLKETARAASNNGFKFAAYLTMSIYSDIFDVLIELKNDRMRKWLYQVVMWSLNEAYEYAASKGIHESSPVLGMLEYKIGKMRELGLPTSEKEYLAKSFCALALLNIKKDDYGALMHLGIQGRVMASENEPSIAIMIAETLGEVLKIVRNNNSFKYIEEKQVRQELESIKKFNKTGNAQISSKVDALLSG